MICVALQAAINSQEQREKAEIHIDRGKSRFHALSSILVDENTITLLLGFSVGLIEPI